jgi:Kef-type K+ transport system membrane component KefB
MEKIFFIAAIWIGLALIATILSRHLKISIALMEITVGTIAGYVVSLYFSSDLLHLNDEWIKFVASTGAVILTFLAGAELDPDSMKTKFKEISLVGLMGFLAPFVGVALIAKYLLLWDLRSSLLAGIALSTTSVAVVYAVMLEYGFNKTEFGKGVLGSCFINDIGTVIGLGLLFSPFTSKMLIFLAVFIVTMFLLPSLTSTLTKLYGNKTAAVRTKWILFILLGLGALAMWAGSEAVLPAYFVGMMLSKQLNKDENFIRRMRTLTIGFLTPFYFLRAGALVSVPAIVVAPLVFVVLLLGKVASKIIGLYPFIHHFRAREPRETWYYTLMMSTGLTFGTISALFGLTHGIITQDQYSYLVAAVIASAVIPTYTANLFFLPKHLVEMPIPEDEDIPDVDKEVSSRTFIPSWLHPRRVYRTFRVQNRRLRRYVKKVSRNIFKNE